MNKHPVFTPRKSNSQRRSARMVLCLGDLPHAAVIERYFQERGWNVLLANSGTEAREMARKFGASVAILAENVVDEESGFLTCWKLLADQPKTRVLLIGSRADGDRMAEFVGAAAYIPAGESAAGIARALQEAEKLA